MSAWVGIALGALDTSVPMPDNVDDDAGVPGLGRTGVGTAVTELLVCADLVAAEEEGACGVGAGVEGVRLVDGVRFSTGASGPIVWKGNGVLLDCVLSTARLSPPATYVSPMTAGVLTDCPSSALSSKSMSGSDSSRLAGGSESSSTSASCGARPQRRRGMAKTPSRKASLMGVIAVLRGSESSGNRGPFGLF